MAAETLPEPTAFTRARRSAWPAVACLAALCLLPAFASPAAAAARAPRLERAFSAQRLGRLILTAHVRRCPARLLITVDGRRRARVAVRARRATDYRLARVAAGRHRVRIAISPWRRCRAGFVLDRLRVDSPPAAAGAPLPPPSSGPPPSAPPAPAPAPVPPEAGPNPIAGARLFVDPQSSSAVAERNLRSSGDNADADQIHKIAVNPQAAWFGDWNGPDPSPAVRALATRAWSAGAVPLMVAYDLPNRDCGGYSAGGAPSAAAYQTWIDRFASALDGPAIVILEPDALAEVDCFDAAGQAQVYALLRYAAGVLAGRPGVSVYMDAGNAPWHTPEDMAARLRSAGIAGVRGFSLNVSSFDATASELAYGDRIAALVGGKHFIVDSGRNGQGRSPDGQWCNPPGRGLGRAPTTATGDPYADAFLWVKPPGDSDGTCNGGPAAGQWWQQYALGLVQAAGN